ncbi:hypothetical protein BDN70DRAFT_693192 [Pholiota conissans]|uniref:F-box domain-containing protein n=1 Tax=Pholiota conissans TaxID=109636 RepID=A0A9P5Z1J1_9AGAR|nr:hypothetical protein BDN70DRAFT_693192 [Pholiota conissans]
MSFASLPALPVELLESIVEYLGWDDVNPQDPHPFFNAARLKNLSHTCRSILPVCRKYLFATIKIRSSFISESRNLPALLKNSPELAGHTRHLYLQITRKPERTEIPSEFKMFSRLKSYYIFFQEDYLRMYNYANIQPQTKELLLHPIPTLTTFKLDNIANFPFHELLRNFPNIRDLEISHILIDASVEDYIPSGALPLKSLKLERFSSGEGSSDHAVVIQKLFSIRQTDGQPLFDISRLKYLKLICADSSEWIKAQTTILLQTSQLTTLILMTNGTCTINLSGILIGHSLLASRMTLKEIRIQNASTRSEYDRNPLHGLCEMLSILGKHHNVLESIFYRHFVYCRCDTGVEWEALDRVFDNHPWSRLRNLSIDIDTNIFIVPPDAPFDQQLDPETETFKKYLEDVPQRLLPKLSTKSKEDLDFHYEVHPNPTATYRNLVSTSFR